MVAHVGIVEVAKAQEMLSGQNTMSRGGPHEAKISVTLLLRGKLGWTLASFLTSGANLMRD